MANFISKNVERQNKRIEQDELEEKELLEAFEAEQGNQEDTDDQEDNSREEKKTEEKETGWKKRYSDLRSHSAKKENELTKRIEELEARVAEQTGSPDVPEDEKELADWMRKYPEVARMIERMAEKIANEKYEDTKKLAESLKEDQKQNQREKDENKIRAAHSDFDQIIEDDAFHDWVEEQSKLLQTAVYESGDPDDVIWALTQYKKTLEKPKSKPSTKTDAAKEVSTKSKSDVDIESKSGIIKESDVAKMSDREYEQNEERINKAIQSGKFEYDLSGAAR